MANTDPAPPLMSGTTLVPLYGGTDRQDKTLPNLIYEFKFNVNGYPDTRVDVEVLRAGESIASGTLTAQAPTLTVGKDGPNVTADFNSMQLTYEYNFYVGSEIFSWYVGTGTVAVWASNVEIMNPPGQVEVAML